MRRNLRDGRPMFHHRYMDVVKLAVVPTPLLVPLVTMMMDTVAEDKSERLRQCPQDFATGPASCDGSPAAYE
ncbi:hypothetical protein Y032_0010g1113 [Ancylostoma ceylanicum]|uniref:Uncharacterized protein n=1 Tax=Ancylostoma ceylanicum TaxID=53326 RepID=A0A016VG10_9BILA|nr:hypothetical protein Y032_0010g1113 [Ancylostoma ceylanicum]